MLYIVCKVINPIGGPIIYRGFETLSQSRVLIPEDSLKKLIINGIIPVVNANISQDTIVLTTWVNGLALEESQEISGSIITQHSGPDYIIIAKKNNRYRFVNYKGILYENSAAEIKDKVASGEVANCRIERSERKNILHTTDVCTIHRDNEFEKLIASKYKSFIAKTSLLGLGDSAFDYTIENHEVRLERYIGSNKEVILPHFITAIGSRAFWDKGIITIKFSSGLKVIGNSAFDSWRRFSGMGHVDIPESVGIICSKAFANNTKLNKPNGTLDNEKFKLLGDRTVMEEQQG